MNSNISQKFAYEIVNGGAVIWRCFSHTSKAVIPSELEGYPVNTIAPYAFSAHMDEKMLIGKKYTLENEIQVLSAASIAEIHIPKLCGNQLEEIVLPHTVKRVGRYCFYNCKNLQRISFTDSLIDWGSGTFTGCHQVQELEVTMYKEEKTTLKDVLVELQEPLVVDYKYENGENSYFAKLVFPEYYEEGVENTPARLINLTIHGSGMRFRNCFQKKVFDFAEYDTRFPYAVFQEKFEIVSQMVQCRLRYPHELREEYRKVYEEYLLEHRKEYGEMLIARRETECLIWFSELLFSNGNSSFMNAHEKNMNDADLETGDDEKQKSLSMEQKLLWLDQMIDDAAKKQYQEAVSFLMDCRHRHKPVAAKKKRSFDFDL